MVITLGLIALTCAVSLAAWRSRDLMERLLFWPPAIGRGEFHRFVSHGLVHADGQHLLFNMITLFFFGRAVEPVFGRYIGAPGFALFYIAAIVVAILPSYIAHRGDARYRSLGASGAVSAVLFAFILMAPWSMLIVLVVPVPAIVFAAAYVAYGIHASREQTDSINHSAHLWGGAFGVAFALCMEPDLLQHFVQSLLDPPLP